MKSQKATLKAVVVTVVLIGALFIVPASSLETNKDETQLYEQYRLAA